MSLSLLSSSSQVSRFPPRLRPFLSSHSGLLADFVTKSAHRDVSTVPYRVLLKSYVEFRSRLKKELSRVKTTELEEAAEASSLLSSEFAFVSPLATAAASSSDSAFKAMLSQRIEVLAAKASKAGGATTVDTEDLRRVACIDAIVAAADCEIDAVLLASVFPHDHWLQVRAPFGPQQQALMLRRFVVFDECESSHGVDAGGGAADGLLRRCHSRFSLLLPDVDVESDPMAMLQKQRAETRVIGGALIRGGASASDRRDDQQNTSLTTIVSSDLRRNTDFMRFLRQKDRNDSPHNHTTEANRRGASTAKSSANLPFVVPFTALHHLGSEVRLQQHQRGGGGGVASGSNSSSSSTMSPAAALRLASTDGEPSEAMRSLLLEKLTHSARQSSECNDNGATVGGKQKGRGGGGGSVVWAVLPPTTEFGLICGWKRNGLASSCAPAAAMTPSGLNTVLEDASARAILLGHRLPNLYCASTTSTKRQVGILSGLKPRTYNDYTNVLGVNGETALPRRSSVTVGRLATASLEVIAAGSVPSVELSAASSAAAIANNGELPPVDTILVDNSQAAAESRMGRLHKNVAEKCSVLGDKLNR